MDEGGFSGTVQLSNISDFIAPSAGCIIPLETKAIEEPMVNIKRKKAEPEEEKKGRIKVTLNDCLACNGCITSAETVLVEEQSLSRLLDGIAGKALSVVSVSPQSVCSIAAARSISASQAAQLISSYFISKGVNYVLDSSLGRILSLEDGWNEFNAISSSPESRLVLASACPGFVCYAEKSSGSLLVPLISTVRSPQAVQGVIVKDYLAKKLELNPTDVYHATVMPCFDKKLEASRPDFLVPGTNIRETDCVISSAELSKVLDEAHELIPTPAEGWLGDFSRGMLIGHPGGSSGGYAENIVIRFMEQQRQKGINTERRDRMVAKNLDLTEVLVDGNVVLRVARVYGFRNIQNLVRKLKTKKCDYQYVEVMACPGGCGNGGGQIRAETTDERQKLLSSVEEQYASIQGSADIKDLLNEWPKVSGSCADLLRTSYRVVDTNVAQKLQW